MLSHLDIGGMGLRVACAVLYRLVQNILAVEGMNREYSARQTTSRRAVVVSAVCDGWGLVVELEALGDVVKGKGRLLFRVASQHLVAFLTGYLTDTDTWLITIEMDLITVDFEDHCHRMSSVYSIPSMASECIKQKRHPDCMRKTKHYTANTDARKVQTFT